MSENILSNLDSTLKRILVNPTPEDLWRIQSNLLALGREQAKQAREVAGEFHSCLRNLESKIASRSASRWGAVLETASVSSVGLQEMLAEQVDPLKRILASSFTAMLEVSAAIQNAGAWEVEASLMYFDIAWYLFGKLWDVSQSARPELAWQEREGHINQLLAPVMDESVSHAIKSALLVRLFQVVLGARVWPCVNSQAEDAVVN
ncbi:MAG: hypothetical protein JXA42_11035 [Anaerolineales bacterium]|nr:hypothetical protein [Anaerolineales bacterium]